MKKYGIQSSMAPYNTLRQNLVHPKDKRPIGGNAEVIYRIPCKQCPGAYVGESGRRLDVRVKEHRKDVITVDNSTRFTRAQRLSALDIYNKSALTDHSSQNNHVINWDDTEIVGRANTWRKRQILETIRIRQEKSPINRDGGNYPLPRLWGPLITETANPSKHGKAVKSVSESSLRQ